MKEVFAGLGVALLCLGLPFGLATGVVGICEYGWPLWFCVMCIAPSGVIALSILGYLMYTFGLFVLGEA